MVDAHGLGRLGDIHVKIEYVDNHLHDDIDDLRAAGRAGDEFELAVLEHHGRAHRRERALSRSRRIGLAADEAEGIGHTGLGGEIVELIVEQHAGARGDEAHAVGKVERISIRYCIAVGIDDRKMRRLVALVGQRIAGADSDEGRARSARIVARNVSA